MKRKRLFYDMFVCGYFESTFEDIMKAERRLNQALLRGETMYLQTFYSMIGFNDVDFDSIFERANNYICGGFCFDREPTVVDKNLECIILTPPFKMVDGIVMVSSNTRKSQTTL